MWIAIRGWQNLALVDFSHVTVAVNCWRDLILRRLQLHTISVDDKNVLIVDSGLSISFTPWFIGFDIPSFHQLYPKLQLCGSDCHHAILICPTGWNQEILTQFQCWTDHYICKNMGRIIFCNMQSDAGTVSKWGALKIDLSNMTHSPNQSKFLRVKSPRIWKSGKISDFVDLFLFISCSYYVCSTKTRRHMTQFHPNSIPESPGCGSGGGL